MEFTKGNIKLICADNMKIMAQYPDNYFDLAVVDPPYGLDLGNYQRTVKDRRGERHNKKDWDKNTPSERYFVELQRISKNQIIWGGNYFNYLAKKETPNLKTIEQFNKYISESSENWIFWYKQNPVPNFADGELAWISFNDNKQFNYRYYGNIEGNTSASNKIHPTQKPVKLYDWIYKNYAKENYKIIDTNFGSASSAISAYYFGFSEYVGVDIDKDYFKDGVRRFKHETAQIKLF